MTTPHPIDALPPKLGEQAIQVLDSELFGPEIDKLKTKIRNDPDWHLTEAGFRITVLARLGRYGLRADRTPAKSWDPYWVALVEIALGVRMRPKSWSHYR